MDGTSSKQIHIIFIYTLDKYHCKTLVFNQLKSTTKTYSNL